MIQLNLLPEVKLVYLRTERNKRLIILICLIVLIVMILLNVLGFTLTKLQKNQIQSLETKAQQASNTFAGFKNLNSILTVQNQISAINTIQNNSPAMGRLFTYLNEILPTNTTLNNFIINNSGSNSADSITMTGQANNVFTINLLVDSLKSTVYSVKGVKGTNPAFSDVVPSAISNGNNNSNNNNKFNASFTINMNFNPTLFNVLDKVQISIPSKYATRSEQALPVNLFSTKN